MARHHPRVNAEPVLEAAQTWIHRCLLAGKSLFEDAPLWHLQTLREVSVAFTDNPDEGDRGFYEKLEDQMKLASKAASRLMAEMLWALMLVQSNIKPERKRQDIGRVWSWSGEPLDLAHPLLSDECLIGIASPGTAFNTLRWRELNYLIRLATDLASRPEAERRSILTSRPEFEAWLQAVPMEGNRQLKHIFRYFAFPEFNERVLQSRHRAQILECFGRFNAAEIAGMADHELDDALLELRKDLAEEYGTTEIDFYDDHIERRWRKQRRARTAPASLDSGFAALKSRFLDAYPRFKSFRADQRYLDDERAYKDELIELFEQSVQPLLAETDWEGAGRSAIDLLSKPLAANKKRPQNLVRFNVVDTLKKLAPVSRARFGRALSSLLDEEQELEDRVESFVGELLELSAGDGKLGQTDQRAVTGMFLTLGNPRGHLFLKTRQLKQALNFLDPGFAWNQSRLTGKDVLRVQELAEGVFERLQGENWFPKDMIDVQGFLWVAVTYGKVAETADDDYEDERASGEGEAGCVLTRQPLNRIFFGPPGTSKTWGTVRAALEILDPPHARECEARSDRPGLKRRFDELVSEGRIRFITFHQSFSYEDFIEGLRADTDGNGALRYRVEPGVFKAFCDLARTAKPDAKGERPDFVLIIDEINRGNVARIFGELITLIEPDKRDGMQEALEVVLPYSKESFRVPANVHLIGTMNTADRSLASMDAALRRRFEFIEMEPDPGVLAGIQVDGLDIPELLAVMNDRIERLLDREHRLGHTHFLALRSQSTVHQLGEIFGKRIIPLLQEYFFDDWERIAWVLNDHRRRDGNPRFVVQKNESFESLFGPDVEATIEVRGWRLNPQALKSIGSFKGIIGGEG